MLFLTLVKDSPKPNIPRIGMAQYHSLGWPNTQMLGMDYHGPRLDCGQLDGLRQYMPTNALTFTHVFINCEQTEAFWKT